MRMFASDVHEGCAPSLLVPRQTHPQPICGPSPNRHQPTVTNQLSPTNRPQAAAADKGNAELGAASKAEIDTLMKLKEELAKAEEA